MNGDEGFVLTHRKIMQWQWYTDVNTAHLFRHCVLRANYIDTSWRGISVKRGSFITSLQTLSAETGLTIKQVRTALEKLEKTGEVASCSTSKYRIITVKNYDLYQSQGKQKGKPKGKQTGKQRAGKGQTEGQAEGKQTATDNKYISNDIYIKEKKVSVVPTGQTDTVKKETSPTAVSPEGEPPAAFDYEKINWSIVQTFKGDDGRDLVYGNIPYKSVGRFSRANGIDDYTASEFYTAFERSKTPFPRNWQKILVRYDKLDSREQDKFIERLHNGEFREKWKE